MKIKSKIIAISLCALCTACGNATESEVEYAIDTPSQACFSSARNTYENGLIYLDGSAYLLDYDTMQSTPLCNRPNCQHKDDTCIANLCLEGSYTPVVYQDMVYWFTAETEIVTQEDSNETTYSVHSICKRAALSTGEVETFAEFDGIDVTGNDAFVLDGNMLYFIGSYAAYQNADGTWTYFNGGGKQYLCSLDLEDGDYQNYGLVNDSPYAENNTIIANNSVNSVSDQVLLQGIYDGKIYMYYQYVEDQQDLIDAIDAGDISGESVSWIYENKTFDLNTCTIETSEYTYAADISEDTYLYWDSEAEQYVALLSDGTEVALSGFSETYAPVIVGQKIWDTSNQMQCFDLETQTVYTITNETYTNGSAIVLDYVDGEYIVEYYDESGTLCFDKVSESDLIQKM